MIKPSFLPAVSVEFYPKDGDPAKPPVQYFRPYAAIPLDELERHAEEHNDMGAMQELGERYYFGILGAEQDDVKAYEWLLKAAANGVQDAEYLIAECYRTGRAVDRDYYKYFLWLDRAAQHGSWMAMLGLAAAYKNGNAEFEGAGPQADPGQAFSWSLEAAASLKAYWAFYTMPRFIDFDDKLAQLMQAYLTVCVQIADCFANGIGTARSLKYALQWLERGKRFGIQATGSRNFSLLDAPIQEMKARIRAEKQEQSGSDTPQNGEESD